MSPIYKVVEITPVTEDTIEGALNKWSQQGYVFSGMQFAMSDASKRPAMAFLMFTKEGKDES